MNEQRKWTIVLMTIAIFVTTAAFLPGLVRAGNLEPSDAPGSTMHTLDEIYHKLELLTSPGLVPVTKTGQTTSYAPGDDGDLEKGAAWPDPRFTDHGDGTVTDNLTGLIWTKDANIYGQRTWANSLSACASCTEGSHSDWRLPNVRELQSLVDYGRWNPALPAGHPFTQVQPSYYWSSSTDVYETGGAWAVFFICGHVDDCDDKGDAYYVWCVRCGQ